MSNKIDKPDDKVAARVRRYFDEVNATNATAARVRRYFDEIFGDDGFNPPDDDPLPDWDERPDEAADDHFDHLFEGPR